VSASAGLAGLLCRSAHSVPRRSVLPRLVGRGGRASQLACFGADGCVERRLRSASEPTGLAGICRGSGSSVPRRSV